MEALSAQIKALDWILWHPALPAALLCVIWFRSQEAKQRGTECTWVTWASVCLTGLIFRPQPLLLPAGLLQLVWILFLLIFYLRLNLKNCFSSFMCNLSCWQIWGMSMMDAATNQPEPPPDWEPSGLCDFIQLSTSNILCSSPVHSVLMPVMYSVHVNATKKSIIVFNLKIWALIWTILRDFTVSWCFERKIKYEINGKYINLLDSTWISWRLWSNTHQIHMRLMSDYVKRNDINTFPSRKTTF